LHRQLLCTPKKITRNIYKTHVGIRFTPFWNGLRSPLRKKNENLWKTEYEFRFIKSETDSIIRFKKNWYFLLKRITESVSHFYETEFVFYFLKIFNFFSIRNLFPKNVNFTKFSLNLAQRWVEGLLTIELKMIDHQVFWVHTL